TTPSDKAQATATQPTDGGNGQRTGGRIVVSPLAARMAADAGINLQKLAGSGPGGRIIKRDIEAAIKEGQQQAQTQPEQRTVETRAQHPAPQFQQPTVTGASPYRDEPVSTMRATIARRLTTSIGPVPHFFLTTEIEMDRVADLRRQI